MNLTEISKAKKALVATKFDEATKASMSKNAAFLVGNTNGLKEGEILSFEDCKVIMMSFDINGTKTVATPCVMAVRKKLDGELELFQLSLASLKRQSYGTDVTSLHKAGTFPTIDVQNVKFSIFDNKDLTKSFVCADLTVVAPVTHLFSTFMDEKVEGKSVVATDAEGNIIMQAKKTTIFAQL